MSATEMRGLIDRVILTELDWFDKSPLVKALRPHGGRWIHFSSLPKLGINPRKSHSDPYGIYFYPVDWLLTPNERLASGQQYGIDWPYYFLCDIQLDHRGYVLSGVTWADVEALAERNGWKVHYDAYRADPDAFPLKYYMKSSHPGDFLWHFIEVLAERKLTTWNRAYRGVSYIYDDNNGIIHANEPHQIVVFDRRLIRNVDARRNNPAVSYRNQDKWEHWHFSLTDMIETVAETYGGTLSWKHKRPWAAFHSGIARFTLKVSDSAHGSPPPLTLEYHHGRAKGTRMISTADLLKSDRASILSQIDAMVREIGSRETDLLFKPFISEIEAQAIIRRKVAPEGMSFTFGTEISNDGGQYADMTVTAERKRVTDAGKVRTFASVRVRQDRFRLFACTNLGEDSAFMTFDMPYDVIVTYDNLDQMVEHQFGKMLESSDYLFRQYSPDGSFSMRYRKFHYQDDFDAFQGWFALNCGLSFEGRMERHFARQIEAYNSYPEPSYLHREIADRFARKPGYW